MMKKILLIRTDRIGDVVLTTPVIQILRAYFPKTHLSFLTGPRTQDILVGNPHLDEVIVYDKYQKHKRFIHTLKFCQELKKKNFDAALIFNPSNRNHLLTFFARIPIRIGLDRKLGFLLTHSIPDKKGEGLKSESFYNEDLLRELGIAPHESRELFFPIDSSLETSMDILLGESGVHSPFIVLHVSSSCLSKQWPAQNFAALAQLAYHKLHYSIVLIGEKSVCDQMIQMSSFPIVSFDEKLSLKKLAILLRKSKVHISSDSGPMHIASAVGTPVISIFGRTQPGLGPKRWAPLKGQNAILHKNIGCHPCLAHLCKLNFDCLKATHVEEVFHAIQSFS